MNTRITHVHVPASFSPQHSAFFSLTRMSSFFFQPRRALANRTNTKHGQKDGSTRHKRPLPEGDENNASKRVKVDRDEPEDEIIDLCSSDETESDGDIEMILVSTLRSRARRRTILGSREGATISGLPSRLCHTSCECRHHLCSMCISA